MKGYGGFIACLMKPAVRQLHFRPVKNNTVICQEQKQGFDWDKFMW